VLSRKNTKLRPISTSTAANEPMSPTGRYSHATGLTSRRW
jgi:hypothetical protein